ncbi:hypothetical protein [Halalkalibacter alkalisediminis]|uniref:Uncharacterized protein n=1 Tax=Halalkalibacter alkalisediminis TaxID=935616 RepID=A0ABV6NJR8_9BACI|nr:hypothetical protein [Halalkalibacter alkalisediminis]
MDTQKYGNKQSNETSQSYEKKTKDSFPQNASDPFFICCYFNNY